MIHIRIESSPPSPRRRGVTEELRGLLAIELDGVEVTGGLLEDRLVPVIAELADACARLLAGESRTAAVHFEESALELILARREDRVRLSLVRLRRPAQVVLRDLEAELEPLAAEVTAVAARLRSEAGDGGEALRPPLRRLRKALASPRRQSPARHRPQRLHRGAPRTSLPSFGFSVHDDEGLLAAADGSDDLYPLLAPGHLHLYDEEGEELCSVGGAPFLLLRDLADAAFRLVETLRESTATTFAFPLGPDAEEVRLELRGGAMMVAGRTIFVPPLQVARALLAAALDLTGALQARNPLLAKNAWLASLHDDARERLELIEELEAPAATEIAPAMAKSRRAPASPPLAPGSLRRLVLRQSWSAELSELRRLHLAEAALWAIDPDGATILDPADGRQLGRVEGESISTAGPKAPLFVGDGAAGLRCHLPDGRLRWKRPDLREALAPHWHQTASDRATLAAGGSLLVLDLADGRLVGRVDPPAATRLLTASSGSLVAAAADNGMLYGVDGRSGGLVFRVPFAEPPQFLAFGAERLFCVVDGREGLQLLALDPTRGEILRREPLPLLAASNLLSLPRGIAVAGLGDVGGEATLCDGAGEVLRQLRPRLGVAPPHLHGDGASFFLRGEEGIARIERGRVRWNVPCGPGAALVTSRGVVALGAERLAFLDAATGRTLHLADEATPPADMLCADGEGRIFAADASGRCVCLQLAAALSIV